MQLSVLITRPRHDALTHYLFCWCEEILDEIKRKSLDVIQLDKDKANKNLVHSYLKKGHANFAIFNGHGNSQEIAGHDNKTLIHASDDLSYLNDKYIFARACSAAAILGPLTIKAGAKCFIGYKQDFWLFHRSGIDNQYFHEPLSDELATPFIKCSNCVVLAMLKGHTPDEANAKSLELYKKEIAKLQTSRTESFSLPFLQFNMMNQICLK